ncbi:cytochrome c biogenesis heme-transporting ATPase CcmA [Spongiibacter sp. KMU-158]|uniref:Cytochrome c biogenesis heme-transporting ATPase CcmA n=1 Tax=Spongiibacter pelagi TaxID=2760804 RepID=A0A927GWD9_9GAMM|nr:cytochrome c biogenesis heme-transporting ATPase CcmA [Spongiibacter pelagi]MBD2859023.1 cytochrome c biogenesis heme-transporting ATPase CcmA [Spongiibacter pelagi]
MSSAILQCEQLYSERDDRVLFADLSFSLAAGEILQIAGPNGAGKTSLLRILAGLSSRFEGELRWRGQSMLHNCAQFHRETHYLGHGAGLKAVLSPLENLRWSCALRGVSQADEAIFGALDKVGLSGYEYHPCLALSAGQQRRVNLARLFCSSAALWILDEPFTAIDQKGVAEIESWLAEFKTAGGMVLLTSHQPLSPSLGANVIDLGAH